MPVFIVTGESARCSACGTDAIRRGNTWRCPTCQRMPKPRPGLGDIVAAGLDRVGITKERVQAVASRVGIKDCGCKRRQQRLNELGRKVGIGD